VPEIRIDPLTGRRAIVETDGATPQLHVAPAEPTDPALDPLAEGYEAAAPRSTRSDPAAARPTRPAGACESSPARVGVAVDVWRERMRAHAAAAYVRLGVDERSASRRRRAAAGGRVRRPHAARHMPTRTPSRTR
jgi:hypothetical protein